MYVYICIFAGTQNIRMKMSKKDEFNGEEPEGGCFGLKIWEGKSLVTPPL